MTQSKLKITFFTVYIDSNLDFNLVKTVHVARKDDNNDFLRFSTKVKGNKIFLRNFNAHQTICFTPEN